jgi:hypothetical protein
MDIIEGVTPEYVYEISSKVISTLFVSDDFRIHYIVDIQHSTSQQNISNILHL